MYEESDPPTFIFTLPPGRLATIIRRPLTIWSSIHIGENLRSGKSLHGERRQLRDLPQFQRATRIPTTVAPPNRESVACASHQRRHHGEKGALIGPHFGRCCQNATRPPARVAFRQHIYEPPVDTALTNQPLREFGAIRAPKKNHGSRECRGFISDEGQNKQTRLIT